GVEQPGIAGFGGEQDQLTDSDDAAVVIGCPALDIAHLIGQKKTLALHNPLTWSTPDGFSTPSGPGGDCHGIVHPAVRRSAGLRLPLLRPHCHLRLPQRALAARGGRAFFPSGGRRTGRRQGDPEPAHRRLPELGGSLRPQSSAADRMGRERRAQGRPCPALATSHGQGRRLRRLLHLQEHGAGAELSHQRPQILHQGSKLPHPRPPTQPLHALLLLPPRRNPGPDGDAGRLVLSVPDHLLPHLVQLHRAGAEAGADRLPQDRQRLPRRRRRRRAASRRRQTQPANHPPTARLLDLILGPKFSVKERKQLNLSRFYAIAQIEYCRNFIFKRNFPIHKLFERSCELGLWRLTADKITEIFGTRVNRRMRGKLATVIDRIEHGHHVFRAYFKNAFLKQYEKFATFLRNELVSNNLADFRLKKGLDHLDAVRQRFQTIT